MIHDPTAAAPKATKQAHPPMAYKFRLYPSPAAALLMDRYAAAERTIYNLAVEYQRELGDLEAQRRRLGGRMSWPDAALGYDDVNAWAAAEAPWLRDIPGSVRAQAVLIARRALLDSFLVKDREAPRFRPRHGGTNGFSWQASRASGGDVRKISKRWHEVRLPVARGATALWCRVRVDAGRQPPPAAYRAGKVLRITRDATGTWWLTMTAPAAPRSAAPEASSCGIDVGVANTLTLADHTGRVLHINMPHLLSSAESNRLRRLQQAQDRTRRTIPCRGPCPHTAGGCWKTSNRYQRRRGDIASLRRRDRRRAHNWTEKVTTNIANRYRLVAVEDLSVRAMTASARQARAQRGRQTRPKPVDSRTTVGDHHPPPRRENHRPRRTARSRPRPQHVAALPRMRPHRGRQPQDPSHLRLHGVRPHRRRRRERRTQHPPTRPTRASPSAWGTGQRARERSDGRNGRRGPPLGGR